MLHSSSDRWSWSSLLMKITKTDTMEEINKLNEIVTSFLGERNQTVITPLGKGHINDSYKVVAAEGEYVSQRINHHIFRNVEQLQ